MAILRTALGTFFGALVGAAVVLYLVPATPLGRARASDQPAVISSASQAEVSTPSVVHFVYQQANPGVVSIVTTNVASPLRSTPQPRQESGAGSGFLVDSEGHIVTNDHVVDGARSVRVIFSDGSTATALIVAQDPGDDLAVIKVDVDADRLHPLSIGDSDQLQVGQTVVAIGNPFDLHNTVTTGIISAVGRSRPSVNGRSIANMIQTDAPVNPGNSGGPLLDDQGKVVGVISQIESPIRGSVGVGFAIPSNTVSRYLPTLTSGGKVQHAWLGISGEALTPDLAQRLKVSATSGVYVIDVIPGGPAAAAGLKGAASGSDNGVLPSGGDVITAVDGTPLHSVQDLSSAIDQKGPSSSIVLTILRDGKTTTLTVKLAVWPDKLPE